MRIAECMSRDVQVAKADQSLREVAQFMLRSDAGSIPVVEGDRLVGMITDRDIAVRAVAESRGPDTPAREAMTEHVHFCYDDEEVEEIAMKMSDAQVRRFPVLGRGDEKLVGIVSLGDLARADQNQAAAVAHDGITDRGGQHDQSTEPR